VLIGYSDEYPSVAVSTIRPRRNTKPSEDRGCLVWGTPTHSVWLPPHPVRRADATWLWGPPEWASRTPAGTLNAAPTSAANEGASSAQSIHVRRWEGRSVGVGQEGGCIEGTPAGMGAAWRRRPRGGTSLGRALRDSHPPVAPPHRAFGRRGWSTEPAALTAAGRPSQGGHQQAARRGASS